jgi:hypothetical protein
VESRFKEEKNKNMNINGELFEEEPVGSMSGKREDKRKNMV